MPWKEGHGEGERLQLMARRLDGEAMTALCTENAINNRTPRYADSVGSGNDRAPDGATKPSGLVCTPITGSRCADNDDPPAVALVVAR